MRWMMLMAAGLAALAMAACGGGDDEITEDEAEDIAAAALLRQSDLPGNGWQETDRDNFEEDEDDFPDTDACNQLNDLFQDLKDEGDDPLAETNVNYAREEEPISLEVEASVAVHATTAKRIDLQERGDDVFGDAGFDDCMEDFAEAAGEDIGGTGEYDRRDPSGEVPDNGFALAFAFTLRVQGQTAEVVGEMYIWQEGRAQVQLSILGTPEQVDEDLVQDIIDEAKDRVSAAQE